MKIFLASVLAVLLIVVPGRAQVAPAPQAAKTLAFHFSSSTSKTKITEFEIGYKRTYSPTQQPIFDATRTGQGGFVISETLSFLDDEGRVLGTLSSAFDARGQLQSQNLEQKGQPTRALDWFKKGTESPSISLPGSILRASYLLKQGRLSQRVLKVQIPDGAREIVSTFDDQGRRIRDLGSSSTSQTRLDLRFFYDATGLVRFAQAASGAEKSKETLLRRDAKGLLSEMLVKEEGVLVVRLTTPPEVAGADAGVRTESYEAGKLSRVTEVRVPKPGAISGAQLKIIIHEEYDDGLLSERKTLRVGPKGEQQLQTIEEFSKGQLRSRAEYDEKGALSKKTTFKPDGSVAATEDFGAAPTPR